MDDGQEIVLKKICCTCLSRDRKLYQLCRVANGVNNLYLLLSFDSEAYREGFYKDVTNLFICWECRATMARISWFREQACVVQKQLSGIQDGRTDMEYINVCRSRLSTTNTVTFDKTFLQTSEEVTDNFIDCGPPVDAIKSEDEEDLPLSELQTGTPPHDSPSIPQVNFDEEKISLENTIPKKESKEKIIRKRKKKKMRPPEDKQKTRKLLNEQKMNESKEEGETLPSYSDAAYKCESCMKEFENVVDWQSHMHEHKETKKKTTAIKKPGSKPRMNAPLRDKPTPLGYPCPECDQYFQDKKQRWKHIQQAHRQGFQCGTCGKSFAFRNILARHEQRHVTPPPRVECPKCHKMIRQELMKVHSRIHSTRESFTCVECDKRFVSRASYEHHLKYTRAHALRDILKYKCSMCEKGYRSRGELRDHVNYNHMGKTRHKCPICNKALATRRCITRHVKRAHDGVKENAKDKICQQCGKAFRDKKNLREHLLIHTGERPLSCSVCGCTFRQHASLYTHRKRVHNLCAPRRTPLLDDCTDLVG